eukprot:m.20024 g.20024  ORF g.20024 m.20024 type:complete len:437 (+) comp12376_c0_seq1:281-1591(+)
MGMSSSLDPPTFELEIQDSEEPRESSTDTPLEENPQQRQTRRTQQEQEQPQNLRQDVRVNIGAHVNNNRRDFLYNRHYATATPGLMRQPASSSVGLVVHENDNNIFPIDVQQIQPPHVSEDSHRSPPESLRVDCPFTLYAYIPLGAAGTNAFHLIYGFLYLFLLVAIQGGLLYYLKIVAGSRISSIGEDLDECPDDFKLLRLIAVFVFHTQLWRDLTQTLDLALYCALSPTLPRNSDLSMFQRSSDNVILFQPRQWYKAFVFIFAIFPKFALAVGLGLVGTEFLVLAEEPENLLFHMTALFFVLRIDDLCFDLYPAACRGARFVQLHINQSYWEARRQIESQQTNQLSLNVRLACLDTGVGYCLLLLFGLPLFLILLALALVASLVSCIVAAHARFNGLRADGFPTAVCKYLNLLMRTPALVVVVSLIAYSRYCSF